VAVVPRERQRDVQAVQNGLARPERVAAVVIDLAEVYRQAVRMALPEAAAVADKFHVIALAGRALRQGRRERRQPRNVAWLMDRAVEWLGPEERVRLGRALAKQPELANGWVLKEESRALYPCRSPPGPLAAGGAAEQPAVVPTGGWHAGDVAQRDPQQPAVPPHERLRGGETQPGECGQATGLRQPNDRVFQLRIPNLIHPY
jgi:hypothetical protein